jgi:FAD/FMN-containing dehydrogenase
MLMPIIKSSCEQAGLLLRDTVGVAAAFVTCRTHASPDGYSLPAFSWFIDQTIAGAVSTGSHGSSLVHGSLSSQVWLVTEVH